MGTRNLICIWYNGRFMVAQYCQWDGYLEGQGATILKFLLEPSNIERLKKGLAVITPVDEKTATEIIGKHIGVSREDRKRCECGVPLPFWGPRTCYPLTLNRDTGAKVFDIIAAATIDDYIPVHLDVEFAQDSLFCEYCYCVDLDAEVFEVFGGATDIPELKDDEKVEQIGKNRFLDVCKNAKPSSTWGNVKPSMPFLLKSWPLSQLPKDLDDMLTQVAAGKVGYYEVERNEPGQDAEDGKRASDTKEDDKEHPNDTKAEADDKAGKDIKQSQVDNPKNPNVEDKQAAVAKNSQKSTKDDAQKPSVQKKKTSDYPDLDARTFANAKERADYESMIQDIAEEMIMEAAQYSIMLERERAAMQQAGTASNKNQTSTRNVREAK